MGRAQKQISLCPSCYCMTRTKDGRCGKCGASKARKKDPLFSVGARLRDKDIWI